MARLKWDEVGEHYYETGTKQGVLYTKTGEETTGQAYGKAQVWNGLTGVTISPSGAEATELWADDTLYLNMYSAEKIGATIEAYQSPEDFDACDGTQTLVAGMTIGQQTRKEFGFCFRTVLGNDEDGNDKGYKLHLLWGCKASPSERAYASVNDSPEAITFSWEVTTTPVNIGTIGGKTYNPTAYVCINSLEAASGKLTALENILYGTDGSGSETGTDAYLPTIAKVYEIMSST